MHTSGDHIQAYLSLGLNFGVKLVEVNLPQFAHLFQNQSDAGETGLKNV